MPCSIEVKNLVKSFGKVCAVDNVSFTAYPSQIIALLGPNGAGKSTLMNMIAGFLSQTSGYVKIFDKNNSLYSIETKKEVGFLPEGAPLYADMSVESFLKYMAELKSLSKDEVKKVMALANIENVAKQKIETLSKGYKRRVGFAVGILGNPPILLLDEPTDGLDPNQKEHMLGLIKDMSKDKTIIISTHLLDEAETIANRIMIMNKGKIKVDGDLEAIMKQTRTSSLENAFIKVTR
ncbi:MAG: ABC transporter ATP-binding protein [Alphaproteobacteria bacterium]|nr:ABC transporter ATP-binding protein [Alphaproteobacteria bacterium]